MPQIPPVTTAGLDDITRRRRHRDVTDLMLNFQHDDSRIRTPTERADDVTPVNSAYHPGDQRRFNPDGENLGSGWFCFGQAATYVNSTTFTVAGDYTTRYSFARRVLLVSDAGVKVYARVRKSTFGSGVTRIVIQADSGNVPNVIASVSLETMMNVGPVTNSVWNLPDDGQHPFFWNTNNDPEAVGGIQIAVGSAAGGTDSNGESIDGGDTVLAIRVTHSTRSTSLLNGGAGTATGASCVIHTGENVPIVIGVNDQERMIFSGGVSAILCKNAEESLRLVSPRVDDLGGIYLTFYDDDNSTRKGYIGFANSGTNNTLELINEKATSNLKIGSTQDIWLAPAATGKIFLDNSGGVFVKVGSGSPESVVTAPVGSLFLRTDGGATTTLYVKTSGAGNTGWTAK
jgi:hypothetical protein